MIDKLHESQKIGIEAVAAYARYVRRLVIEECARHIENRALIAVRDRGEPEEIQATARKLAAWLRDLGKD
jgi:hypothetical protein